MNEATDKGEKSKANKSTAKQPLEARSRMLAPISRAAKRQKTTRVRGNLSTIK